MNPFVRLTAVALLATFALDAAAQRVQFPTATQPLSAAPPSTYAAPPPSTSPFATNPVTPPLYSTPPSVYTPSTAPAAVSPPPAYSTPVPSTPTYTPPAYPSTTAPALSTPAPTYSSPAPFTSAPPPFGTSPAMPPPSLAPTAPAPGSVAPPLFDPYASGTPFGAPPANVPYNYTPPPVGTVGPQSSPLYPEGVPPMQGPWNADGSGIYQQTLRVLQELSFEYTYLYGEHSDPNDLEINRAEVASTFAVPMFYNIDTPLLITPGFAFNWLDGPVPPGPDMPPQLYDAYLDFAWYPKVTPWLGAELGFRTGVWSDFDRVTTDSIRLLGRGLASVSVSPTLDILFGVVYLDRVKVKILPAGGVYWRPTPEWDAYIVFPNPKVRKYWMNIGNSKMYWYVGGEYGMGSWTVTRDTIPDRVDINDIRVFGGIECETQTKIRTHLEVGYVWDRELVFTSGMPGEYGLNDTVMLRAGVDF